jgi:hypothetical protein
MRDIIYIRWFSSETHHQSKTSSQRLSHILPNPSHRKHESMLSTVLSGSDATCRGDPGCYGDRVSPGEVVVKLLANPSWKLAQRVPHALESLGLRHENIKTVHRCDCLCHLTPQEAAEKTAENAAEKLNSTSIPQEQTVIVD